MRRPGAGANRRQSGFRGIGATSASPQTIPGLYSWYRADQLVTLAGSNVSAWGDITGAGRSLTQGTAGARPTFVASNALLNKHPSLSFDGGDSLVGATAADWTLLHSGSGMTLAIIAYGDAADTVYAYCGTQTTVTSLGFQIRTNASGSLIWDIGNGSADIMNQTLASNLDTTPFHATMRYEEGRAGNEYAYSVNDVATTTGNSAAAPSASDSRALRSFSA